ncbi:MAG: addiction module protein [Chromatiales bacterium]
MTVTIPLEKMSVAEKIQMMESIWDDLCQHADSIVSPSWHQDVLAQREESLSSGADKFEDWDKAKADIQRQVP